MTVRGIYMEQWDKDKHPKGLRTFDNVKLVALSTCPQYGILRYEHHKTWTTTRRQMPLEAGLACHEAFSAVRLADLYLNGGLFYPDSIDTRAVALARMIQLFGMDRTVEWTKIMELGEDTERTIMLGALEIFNSSGFFDDESDKRRTVANIEEALIVYCTRYPIGRMMPVVIEEEKRLFVGVEIPVDMYLRIDNHDATHEYHFTGRIDGMMYRDPDKREVIIEDDKTASRLDEAWRTGWSVNHQPTGYCLAASALLKQPVTRGNIRGLAIPIPKTYDYGGHVVEPFRRTEQQFTEWAEWVVFVDETTKRFLKTPLNAPKFTHSCNRYFHSCMFVPFCDSDEEERQAMYDEMETVEWSPLGERYVTQEGDD